MFRRNKPASAAVEQLLQKAKETAADAALKAKWSVDHAESAAALRAEADKLIADANSYLQAAQKLDAVEQG